jgi:hypothetical protein
MGNSSNLISLGTCLVGQNLNLVSIRGNAPLGVLAQVSAADKYDQLSNEAGVQRSPAEKHAREALAYALGAEDADSRVDPRAFTEVILNARDVNPFSFRANPSGRDVDVIEVLSGEFSTVEVRIDTALLDHTPFPGHESIQISRVDGNHRLLIAERLIERGEILPSDFPTVPFAIFLALTPEQERKIFVDINGNHKSMSKSLMLNFMAQHEISDSTSISVDELAGWIALKLCSRGMVFDEMVNLGGDLRGYRLNHSSNPPLTLVGVTNAMKDFVSAVGPIRKKSEVDPDFLLTIINDFLEVVKEKFEEAFDRPYEYVVLKALGLTTLAKLAGTIYANADITPETYSNELSLNCLSVLQSEVDFGRFNWSGYTGKAGMKVLYQHMQKVLTHAGYGDLVK